MPYSTKQHSITASYYRGGTSRALIFHEPDLPSDLPSRRQIFLQAIGAPDIHGRQLNGLGAGISSLSKVCIIGTEDLPDDIDVLYTFAGIGIEKDEVDFAGNCGNMASAVGPYSFNNRLLFKQHQEDSQIYERSGRLEVSFLNTNTNTKILSSFIVEDGQARVDNETSIDGVSGLGTGVKLDFIRPGGSKTGSMLPTGKVVQTLAGYEVSCIDSANPCVFVRASDLGVNPAILPAQLMDLHETRQILETIRTAGAIEMGMIKEGEEPPRVIPKIALVSPRQNQKTLSGKINSADELDLVVRFISDAQPHRAIPLTGALCTATAAKIPGSIVHQCLPAAAQSNPARPVRIGHPSGKIEVDAVMDSTGEVKSASVIRTARRIFEGQIFWNP
jgi:2-methylaconitate cis-trans-isomerase PrpF